MKWIGQHIWDFITRFRSDVYLEAVESGTIASGGNLGLDANNKIVKESDAGITDLHGAGVDGSANQLLTDDGDGTVTSESSLKFTDSPATLTIGSTKILSAENISYNGSTFSSYIEFPSYEALSDIGIGAIIKVADGDAGGVKGAALTLEAGDAYGTNMDGGDMRFVLGARTGTGSLAKFKFYGSNAGAQVATIDDNGLKLDIADTAIIFEGGTHDTTLKSTATPSADRAITLPDATGTVALTSDISYPVTASNTVTLSNKSISLGSNTVTGTTAQFNTALTDDDFATIAGSETLTNKTLTTPTLSAPVLKATSATVGGKILFKEGTDNGTNAITLLGAAATADVTITLPAETGTVLTTGSSIANSNLANSSVTIGSTACALGATAASITGVTSITAAAVVTDDDGFRIRDNADSTKQAAFECSTIATGTTRTFTLPNASGTLALAGAGATEFADNVFRVNDNSDATKQLAFECSGISGSTTRTMTVPNENGTISTESFATAIAVALG